MKLSTKLLLSFTVVTFLLLAIGAASQYLNNRVKDQVVAESEKAIHELKLSGRMGTSLYRSLINIHYYLEDRYRKSLNGDLDEVNLNVDQVQDRIRNALDEFNESLMAADSVINKQAEDRVISTGFTDSSSETLDQLKSRFAIYAALVNQLLPLARQNYDDGKEFFTVTIEPYFRTNILPLVDRLQQETQNNLDQEIVRLNENISDTSTILAIATVVAFLLSLVLAYYLYHSIATPLQVLSVAAQHIGAGNLDERIEINTRDEIGRLGLEFNRMAENLSKTTVSRNFMDDIIESMADALIVTDDNCRIQKVNSATVDMLGYAEEEILGKQMSAILINEQQSEINEIGSESAFKNYETAYRAKSGDTVPVSLSRAHIHDINGKMKGTVCVASDITRRKMAESQIKKSLKEKEILLAEIHHRVKNNLAVISGLLQMQIWDTENEAAETALKDSQLRVRSIALVHEKLYQSESLSFIEFDKYIHDLLQAISDTYMSSSATITVEADLDPVALNINQAIPCSLLLNELVANAYKHAFDDGANGLILVKLWKEAGGDTIFLRVSDNGSGITEGDEDEGKTWGMSLIETLVLQLNGTLQVSNDNGAVFDVHFPREEVV